VKAAPERITTKKQRSPSRKRPRRSSLEEEGSDRFWGFNHGSADPVPLHFKVNVLREVEPFFEKEKKGGTIATQLSGRGREVFRIYAHQKKRKRKGGGRKRAKKKPPVEACQGLQRHKATSKHRVSVGELTGEPKNY